MCEKLHSPWWRAGEGASSRASDRVRTWHGSCLSVALAVTSTRRPALDWTFVRSRRPASDDFVRLSRLSLPCDISFTDLFTNTGRRPATLLLRRRPLPG